MLRTGWKEIQRATGRSRNTIKKLMETEAFPVLIINSKPTTTDEALKVWFDNQLNAVKSAYDQLSCDEISQRMVL